MNYHEELKATQRELTKLTARQLELQKQHQQQLYEREKHATWYQKLVGEPPLREDPEVTQTQLTELLSIKETIADLKRREGEFFKVILVYT
jgi:hypothetical protein